jgi:hypothetical protein
MGTLLVCGETNASADNLAAGALEAGLSVARVGSPARVLFSVCVQLLCIYYLQLFFCSLPISFMTVHVIGMCTRVPFTQHDAVGRASELTDEEY